MGILLIYITMIYLYKSVNINYEIIGNGSNKLIFLHGWGGEIDSFKFICKYLKFDYKAMFIDFPPFGKSEEMSTPWTIFDYATMTNELIKKEKMENSVIVGHSFGGRVAVILSNLNIGKKLILVDSAGLKPKHSLFYYIKTTNNKIKKKLGIKKIKGSKDYEKLSPIMKKTFVNIVNTFLEEYAINIKVPTVIFWGKKDKETPIYMAKRFNKLIKNSELVIIKKAGHFSYIEDFNTFINVLNYLVINKY